MKEDWDNGDRFKITITEMERSSVSARIEMGDDHSQKIKDALKRAKALKELKLQCPEWQAFKLKWSLVPVPQRTSEQWNEYVEDATKAKAALDLLEANRVR